MTGILSMLAGFFLYGPGLPQEPIEAKHNKAIVIMQEAYDKQSNKAIASGCTSVDLGFDGRYLIDVFDCEHLRTGFYVVTDLKEKKWYRIWQWQVNKAIFDALPYAEADEKDDF